MADEQFRAREVVRRYGGSARWQDILKHTSSHSVRKALESGELRRLSRGTYALPEIPLAKQAAAATGGLVSHASAAEDWELEMLAPPTSAHITVPHHSSARRRSGVTLHYSDVPAPDERNGVTSPVRTVLDCALTLPLLEALTIADSALRKGVESEELIVAAHRRRGPGRQKMIRVAEAATKAAANPFESATRGIILKAGITGFIPQLEIQVRFGSIHVDLGDPVRRIAIEADSSRYHFGLEAQRADMERYNELVRAGWLVLRFAWQQVMFEPTWVAETVADTCALRDSAPTQ